MKIYNYTAEELGDIAKTGADLMLDELHRQNKISTEDLDNFHINYTIIVKKPSRIAAFWKRLIKKDEERFILVKQCSLKADPETDEKDADKA